MHLLPRFPNIQNLTPASMDEFYKARPREVKRETVRKDKAILVRFVKWASMQGRNYIDRVDVPPLPKKVRGVKAVPGREVTEIDRAEVLAILRLLPTYSERSSSCAPSQAATFEASSRTSAPGSSSR